MIAQVQQAVTDGELTQERADALIERIQNSEFPPQRHRYMSKRVRQ